MPQVPCRLTPSCLHSPPKLIWPFSYSRHFHKTSGHHVICSLRSLRPSALVPVGTARGPRGQEDWLGIRNRQSWGFVLSASNSKESTFPETIPQGRATLLGKRRRWES